MSITGISGLAQNADKNPHACLADSLLARFAAPAKRHHAHRRDQPIRARQMPRELCRTAQSRAPMGSAPCAHAHPPQPQSIVSGPSADPLRNWRTNGFSEELCRELLPTDCWNPVSRLVSSRHLKQSIPLVHRCPWGSVRFQPFQTSSSRTGTHRDLHVLLRSWGTGSAPMSASGEARRPSQRIRISTRRGSPRPSSAWLIVDAGRRHLRASCARVSPAARRSSRSLAPNARVSAMRSLAVRRRLSPARTPGRGRLAGGLTGP
jgi:hypothetical protein